MRITVTRRRRMIGGGAVLLAVATVAAVAVAAPSGGEAETAKGGGTSLVAVRQGPLSSQVSQSGTLSYAVGAGGTPYQVVNQAKGTYTRLPVTGALIDCGETLYKVDQEPVILVCGSIPAYRDLSVGDDGKDVRALNKTLVGGGHASGLDPESRHFGRATAAALEKLQDERGADVTGRLDLGQAVFLPGPLRIGTVTAGNGTGAVPGRPVMEASSNRREVVVELDPSQQSEVEKGDAAQITLPDNRTTPGMVTRIGTVAKSSGKDADTAPATLPVAITLKHPKDAGTLDQAPVQVVITTDGVKNALSVPVTALLGRAGGGYEVEVATGDGGGTRFVPVTLGLFDHADGRVQVSGALAAGDRVVVPST
ncbi:efflux RND transporter periplasmic adaptor subunit [Actinomadura sp. B10D3]|uniref:efflux RND transporter periplasmic adaptor subunit n=1 Tax=Actinomadura sp. B10D3 TaxID=3153557 RepID=UPI00325F24C8